MSDTTQIQKPSATHPSTKPKVERGSHQPASPVVTIDSTGPAPEELLSVGPSSVLDPSTSGVLSHESSALFQSHTAAGDAGSARSAALPKFAGKNFAGVPTHSVRQATVQPKLTVGAAHDTYEEEADQVAEQVMRMPTLGSAASSGADAPEQSEHAIQRTSEEDEIQAKPLAATIRPFVQRTVPTHDDEDVQRAAEEDVELQAKRASAADSFETGHDFEDRVAATRGGGSPLPAEVRTFMEPRFGADFSGVRVHAGGEAAELNRSVSAQAFTLGHDIYLGEGKTDVASEGGKRLLAHELTHVVQQGGAGQLRRAPKDEEEDKRKRADAGTPQSDIAQVDQQVEADSNSASQQLAGQPVQETLAGAAPNGKLAPRESFGKMVLSQEHQKAETQPAQEAAKGATLDKKSLRNTAGILPREAAQTTLPDQSKTAPAPLAETTGQEKTDKSDKDASKAPIKSEGAQTAKPARATLAQDKKPGHTPEQAAAKKDKATAAQAGVLAQVKPDAKAKVTEEPAQTSPDTNAPIADQPAQGDGGIIEEVQSQAKEAQNQRVESDQLVQQTTAELDDLNGVEAIIPESLWQALKLDQRNDLDMKQPPPEPNTRVADQADAIIQRSPDLTLQRKPADSPQAAPQQISIPTITLDTTPISSATTAATANVGFAAKQAELQRAVAAKKQLVTQLGAAALIRLDTQLATTLTKLGTDAQKAKDDVTTKFDAANKSLDTLQQGLPARVSAIIQAGCQKIDAVVSAYVNKCEPDATAAIQGYCNTQRAIKDDGTIPPFGPGEESGYHAKKADAALKAAQEVGQAYAAEYRKQGEDTKGAFQGQVRTDLTQTMQNEITGMRTTLTTARDGAWTEIDTTKTQLIQQANDLHRQSVSTLNAATTSTLADLTNYQTQLTTELTKTQTSFQHQMQAESDQAIAQAQAALASAQTALAAAIRSATGPDKILKPGAQAAIDKAAADIQAQLNQQVRTGATQITQQGAQMSATVAGIDVQSGSNAYATTFETTTKSMLDQVITGGLVVINTNMIDFGTQVTTQAGTTFTSYVTAATNSLQQIDDASKTNLPTFVDNKFKPGLDQAHQKLASQARAEGEKAGDAVQPAWKAWAKAIISIVVAIVVAVAIVAIVAATGGVAGILLGVLAGAAIGAAGGAIKCIANNLIDGKPPFENIGREMATGALSGALQGLTAGVLGVAFQGSLTVGQMVLKEGIDAAAGGLRDGVTEILSQGMQYGWDKIDWGSIGVKALEGFVINVVTAGIFKGPGILKAAGEADTALTSAAKQVDNGLENAADQAPASTGWARPPRTPSEIKAEALGWPEPQPGYRWNMSGSGTPYQQRIPGMGDVLPEPPKFTLPEGQLPLGLPGVGPITPKVSQPLGDIPVTSPPGAIPGQLQLPFMPNSGNSQWTQAFWEKAGQQLPPRATKETLKQGDYLLADNADWWTSSREMSNDAHHQPVAPGINMSNPSIPTGSSNTTVTNPNWNIPVPSAPHYNPADWNFQTNQSVSPILTPEEISQFNFGANFDEDQLENAVSNKKP